MKKPLELLKTLGDRIRSTLSAAARALKAAPDALKAVPKAIKASPKVALIVAGATLVAAAAVVLAVLFAPRAGLTVQVSPPELRELSESSSIPGLGIEFSGSAAKIELEGKQIEKGISIAPEIEGKWYWTDSSRIMFAPTADWEPGRRYTVSFDASLFSDKARISTKSVSFNAPAFKADIGECVFSIDPLHPTTKRITATVRFSHPVKPGELEKAVRLKVPHTVSWDKYLATAYIVSESIPVPEKGYTVELRVSGRISSIKGGSPFTADLKAEVTVPGRYDYAAIKELETGLVRDESYEYRKLLIMRANLGMRPEDVARATSVYLLPKDRPEAPGTEAEKDHAWQPEEIDAKVLQLSKRLELAAIPIEGEYGEQVSFSFTSPSQRFVYVQVDSQIEAFGGYIIKSGAKRVLEVPKIPQEVRIMNEGSLLSMSGEKKISLFSNDVEWVQFEIGRIIPDQVNNLVTQLRSDIKNMPLERDWGFGLENMASLYQEVRQLRKLEPGQVQYFSFDFDRYLTRESDPRLRYGLFSFKVSNYNPETKTAMGPASTRFILVTDLGLLVKKNVDIGYDMFVQSIHSGAPVADARVEVIGKNGLAVVSAVTKGDGHVFVPALTGFTREKTPEAFVVTRGGDMSFLPLESSARFLNFSRFDTGGVFGTADPGFIDAYLFSDRGIYRPGDSMHFGLIVKAGDWRKDLAGLPLELSVEDPRGLEIQKQRIALSASGFEQYSFRTEETAQTGKYEIRLFIARDKEERKLLGSTSVKVEEFQPDKLSIRSYFSVDAERKWVSPKDLKATVSLMNLFGTPAEGNPVRARIALSPTSLFFPRYPDYVFFDPFGEGKTFEDELGERATDGNGIAEFPIDLERFAAATFLLRFSADGLEKQGGRGVHAESSVVVSPLHSIVGYKPDGRLDYIFKDSQRAVHLVSVGPDQAPVPIAGLKMSVSELRFVSVLEKGPDGLYRYRSVEKKVSVKESGLAIPKEGKTLNLATDSPGDFEVTIADTEGGALSSFRYSVIGTGNLSRSLDRNAELQIRLDKSDCAGGDSLQVSVKAPYTGSGLITIERDRVYAYKWFSTSTSATVQSIRIPESLEGTAYVNVSFIRAIDSREIYASPLSYGVVPITVNKNKRSNPITLKAEEELLAGRPLKITYSSEKPGRIVVFAVDEGILQVGRYATPRPLDHFFTKRALEVQTSQILDLILPEFSVIQSVSAAGGDEGDSALARNLNPFKRKNKPPAVFWSGILPTDSVERTVEYAVPDYFNGTLRIMAVAVSPDSIGVKDRKTVVRSHFVISPNVPPVATPGDEIEIGVSVMNDLRTEKAQSDVAVELKASEHFELITSGPRSIPIAKKQEKTVFYTLRVRDTLGAGTLRFTASSGGASSSMEESVSIRPSTPFRTQLDSGRIRKADAEVALQRRMHDAFRSVEVSASYLPSGMSYGLKKYLDAYPYGCTEQIVSRAFAALALKRIPDFGVTDEEARAGFDHAQKVLRARQNQDGSFGLWAANENVSDFINAYAMHYLTEARESGYPVDGALFQRGMQALQAAAGADPQYKHTTHVGAAYAIYVLTRNGVVTTSFINTLRAPKTLKAGWRDGPVAIFLAGAYAIMKQAPEARDLLAGAFNGKWSRDFENDYYIALTQNALCLFMAGRHIPELSGAYADKALERIVDSITASQYNTIASSYAILALTSYATAASTGAQQRLKVLRKVGEKEYEELAMKGDAVLRARVPAGSAGIKVSNPADNALYYQVMQSGFDLKPPAETAKHGIEVFREYTDANNKAVSTVGIGDEVLVHVKIRTIDSKKPTVENIAIVDMLPAGFELSFDRSGDEALGTGSLSVAYAEPREDRMLIVCTAESAVKDYVYRIRSINKGRFAVPPVFAESMYDKKTWTQHPSEGFIVVGNR